MGEIRETADIVYSDFNTPDVPETGLKRPVKSAIRDLFGIVEDETDDLQAQIIATNEILTTSYKQIAAVRVVATANVNLATGLENGDVVDGITLITGDRVALPIQSTGTQNGVYIVAASGAAPRSADADIGAELGRSSFAVTSGTRAGQVWGVTNAVTMVIGVDTPNLVHIYDLPTPDYATNVHVTGDQDIEGTKNFIDLLQADEAEIISLQVGSTSSGSSRLTGDSHILPITDNSGRNVLSVRPDGSVDATLSKPSAQKVAETNWRDPALCRTYRGVNGRFHPDGGIEWDVVDNGYTRTAYQRPSGSSTQNFLMVTSSRLAIIIHFFGQSNAGVSGISKLRSTACWNHHAFMFDDANGAGQSGASALIDDKRDFRPLRDQDPLAAHFPATFFVDALVAYSYDDNDTPPAIGAFTAYEGGQNASAFIAGEVTTEIIEGVLTDVAHYNVANSDDGIEIMCREADGYNTVCEVRLCIAHGEAGGLDKGDGSGGQYPTTTYPAITDPGAWSDPWIGIINERVASLQTIVAASGGSTRLPPVYLFQTNAQRSGGFATPHGVELEQLDMMLGYLVLAAIGSAKVGNTGNGSLSGVTVGQGARRGRYTICVSAIAADTGVRTFLVTHESGLALGPGNPTVAYSQGGISFTLSAGSTPAIVNDTWYVDVSNIPTTDAEFVAILPMCSDRFSDWNIHTDGLSREMEGERLAYYERAWQASKWLDADELEHFEPQECVRMKSMIVHPDDVLKRIIDVVNPTFRPGTFYIDPFEGYPLRLENGWGSGQAPVANYGLGIEQDTNGAVITAVEIGPLPNQITITLDIQPASGWYLNYAMTPAIDADWDIGTTYATGDRVDRNSKVYKARRDTTGEDPETSSYAWELVPGWPACRGSINVLMGRSSFFKKRWNDNDLPDPFLPMVRHRIAGVFHA